MTEDRTPEFVIGDDFENDEHEHMATAKKESESLRIERLNTRVTLITVLIPILIGAISYLGYVDISKKVTKVSASGTNVASTLSKDLDSKFSNLSVHLSEIDDNFKKKAQTIEKSLDALSAEISKMREEQKNHKKDIDYLAAMRKKTDEKIEPITNDISSVKKEISQMTKTLSNDISDISYIVNNMKKELISYKSQLATLSSSKLNKESFDKEMGLLSSKIDKTAQQLEQKIKTIEKKLASNGSSSITPSSSSKPSASQHTSQVPSASPPDETIQMTKNKPGVIEQDIRE